MDKNIWFKSENVNPAYLQKLKLHLHLCTEVSTDSRIWFAGAWSQSPSICCLVLNSGFRMDFKKGASPRHLVSQGGRGSQSTDIEWLHLHSRCHSAIRDAQNNVLFVSRSFIGQNRSALRQHGNHNDGQSVLAVWPSVGERPPLLTHVWGGAIVSY